MQAEQKVGGGGGWLEIYWTLYAVDRLIKKWRSKNVALCNRFHERIWEGIIEGFSVLHFGDLHVRASKVGDFTGLCSL